MKTIFKKWAAVWPERQAYEPTHLSNEPKKVMV